MKWFLYLLSVLAFCIGFLFFESSKSAFQETEALVLFLIGTVFYVGGAIVSAINKAGKELASNKAVNHV